ncbi:glycerophosphodiester phosphodiesterase [Domibacillus epiphyticus]|uniref:Glycerophosphodiester phosphodiesterase n=1 Tax=Domibacillus epiphyticus TaxID=1714355 RepID=A0A1V2ABK8_9BACI|nr:glycerophosphodiester phosphodiesterase [Domibacillus epiphyticus]OMP68378.1 glycerophosphodiester phosphodiesterase [Domibacillus epiphyticus]
MTQHPVIFAHRGASGTHPENTMAAFEAAAKLGAGGIELDVQVTKDGEIVIIHDETVNRTTNGQGFIQRMTYKEVAGLDAGSWFDTTFAGEKVPTLDEFFTWASGNELQINIELKTNKVPYHGIEQKVLELIEDYRMRGRVIISSFNLDSVRRVIELDPYIAVAGLVWRIPREAVMNAKKLGLTALHTQVSFALSEYGKAAVNSGILLRLYTINEKREWMRVKESGMPIEAIITDFPERFL